VPLLDGCTSDTFNMVFEKVINGVVTAFKPDCVVLQCGADGLAGDPLGGWNLTLSAYRYCLEKLSGFNVPLMVLGGGGYNSINVAKCFAHCTLVLAKGDFETDIPEHEFWPLYKPNYELILDGNVTKDMNLEGHYLENLLSTVIRNINQIQK
jgi:acetoin utilization deacetylase AcuC-like enzyme